MPTTVSILTLRLLDIVLSNDPDIKKMLLNGAKDLAREYHEAFEQKGLDLYLFHNDRVEYSGIQLGRYRGAVEWTAIGEKHVEALKLWYECFKKENPIPLRNTVVIKERYTPTFLNHLRKYRVSPLLVSDQVAQELRDISDKFARNDRMERYLFGNLLVFFKHIGFESSKEQHFLKIVVEDCYRLPKALPVYHGNKKSAYRVTFSCNFLLPQTLRLGQSTAIGYGRVVHV